MEAASAAIANRHANLAVVGALIRRAFNELVRVPGGALPGIVAPTIFLIGLTSVFGHLDQLIGFTGNDFISFLIPITLLQAATFTGAATGVNLARDIELGWFDRLLVAPVPRPILVLGPILGGVTRCLVPTTVVLTVGLLLGAELSGGLLGLVALYVASSAFCACAARCCPPRSPR